MEKLPSTFHEAWSKSGSLARAYLVPDVFLSRSAMGTVHLRHSWDGVYIRFEPDMIVLRTNRLHWDSRTIIGCLPAPYTVVLTQRAGLVVKRLINTVTQVQWPFEYDLILTTDGVFHYSHPSERVEPCA